MFWDKPRTDKRTAALERQIAKQAERIAELESTLRVRDLEIRELTTLVARFQKRAEADLAAEVWRLAEHEPKAHA